MSENISEAFSSQIEKFGIKPSKIHRNYSAEKLVEIAGAATVPQIIVNDTPIGGFDNLLELDQNGKLNEMLKI